ncbi:carbonic anhydrase [Piscinibacter sakaiensis]|uniref:carbonic anhydrase n=1 Tax=Piscinibacter sakaiensis TaxID=1547922 RepID=UPI003AB09C16
MFLLPRLAAAAAVFVVQLPLSGAALSASPPPLIDPQNSPSRETAPRAGTPGAAAIVAAKTKELPAKDSPEQMRQRLVDALSAADGKSTGAGAAAKTLQIVNRREPASQPATAVRTAAPAAPPRAGAEPMALVPGSTARLAAVQRLDAERRETTHGAAAHAHGAPKWAYDGPSGPHAWADLKPEYATCASGQRQSPIDLRDGLKLQLEPIGFNYAPSSIRVVDTGHTIQVNVGAGNWIEVMGRRFELQQFHFHKPSEERIDGRRFDMDAHLVHRDADGRLAIVAVLLSRGAAQPLIQTVWNNLPLEKGSDQLVGAAVDLNALLPTARGYFAYMGSLTEPPCTEDVLWLVMKSPVEISPQQIAIFDRLYPMNARPVQATAGRMIKESE